MNVTPFLRKSGIKEIYKYFCHFSIYIRRGDIEVWEVMEKKIKEIIRKNYEKNVTSIPWDGMHDEAVEKIMKIIEEKA